MFSERSTNGGIDEVPLPRGSDNTMGRLWLCGKHFIGPDVEAAIQRVNATHVVCLVGRRELIGRYDDYVAWLDREHPTNSIRAHINDTSNTSSRATWCPFPDLGIENVAATQLTHDLVSRLTHGETLLVHCGAGIGRAGTIAAAVLISLGTPLNDALRIVAASRPMAGPEAGAQMMFLQNLSQNLSQNVASPTHEEQKHDE